MKKLKARSFYELKIDYGDEETLHIVGKIVSVGGRSYRIAILMPRNEYSRKMYNLWRYEYGDRNFSITFNFDDILWAKPYPSIYVARQKYKLKNKPKKNRKEDITNPKPMV